MVQKILVIVQKNRSMTFKWPKKNKSTSTILYWFLYTKIWVWGRSQVPQTWYYFSEILALFSSAFSITES